MPRFRRKRNQNKQGVITQMLSANLPSRDAVTRHHLLTAMTLRPIPPTTATRINGSVQVPPAVWSAVRRIKFLYAISTKSKRKRSSKSQRADKVRVCRQEQEARQLSTINKLLATTVRQLHAHPHSALLGPTVTNLVTRLRQIIQCQARPLRGSSLLANVVQFLLQMRPLLRTSRRDREFACNVAAVGLILYTLLLALHVLSQEDIHAACHGPHSISNVIALLHEDPIQWGVHRHSIVPSPAQCVARCYCITLNPRPETHSFQQCRVNGVNRMYSVNPSSKMTCKWCWREFGLATRNIDFLCMVCANGLHRCHIDELIAIGRHFNIAMCPACCMSLEWRFHVRGAEDGRGPALERALQKLRAYSDIALVFVHDDYGYIRVEGEPDTRSTAKYVGDVLIPHRFVRINLQWANDHLSEWDDLVRVYKERPIEVSWKEYRVNLCDITQQFFASEQSNYVSTHRAQNDGALKVNPWTFQPSDTFSYWISSIGSIRDNGYVIWPALLDRVGHGRRVCRELVTVLHYKAFGANHDGLLKRWVTDYCSCTAANNKDMSMFSVGLTYKSSQTCWKEIRSHDIAQQDHMLLHWDQNNLDLYWKDHSVLTSLRDRVKRLNEWTRSGQEPPPSLVNATNILREKLLDEDVFPKPPKVKVATTNIDAAVNQQLPELKKQTADLQLLSSILNYTVHQHHPHLRAFGQYRAAGYLDGEELRDVDYQQYREHYHVVPHRDALNLIDTEMKVGGPFYIFKLNPEMRQRADYRGNSRLRNALFERGENHVLCMDSIKGNGCVKKKDCGLRRDLDSRGHFVLTPGSVYTMFGYGATGGTSHAIHAEGSISQSDELMHYGGMTKLMYNICARPMSKQQQ